MRGALIRQSGLVRQGEQLRAGGAAPESGGQPRADAGDSAAPSSVLDVEAFYFSTADRRWYFGAFIASVVMSQIGGQTAGALGEYSASDPKKLLTDGLFVVRLGGACFDGPMVGPYADFGDLLSRS